ncbi:MAG: protein TolR [Halobacteriovoraceae bacterium]|nr:protein TolR [Halobacteriovoraceae bacterium]|tara:strand:- start:9389 stop:9805 length:417 start_codon:yes stop_codon:yes gene_type:complete
MSFKLNDKKGPISDINVTPLVDVMLVLLVIFMVSAPLMFSGVNLDLPKTKKVNNLKLTQEQVILSINRAGEFFIGKEKYLKEEILSVIEEQMKKKGTKTVFLRADYGLDYGNVARTISALKNAGISQISLVTEIDKKP